MPMDNLQDLLVDNLKDLYSAEKQLVAALPKMARKATTPALKTAIESHLQETEGHVGRLEQAFELLGHTARAKTCKAMQGLIEEGGEVLEQEGEDMVIDAGIIGAAQRVEHYEMAAYGTVVAYARRLGNDELAELLESTLEEEKAADEKLNDIAEAEVNPAAASGMHGEAGDERTTGRSPTKRKSR